MCIYTCSDCSGDVKRENRFVRAQPRLSSQPIRRPGDRPQRPAIINPEDLKDLDELDNECEDGWAGQYFSKLLDYLQYPLTVRQDSFIHYVVPASQLSLTVQFVCEYLRPIKL